VFEDPTSLTLDVKHREVVVKLSGLGPPNMVVMPATLRSAEV